MFCQLTTKEKRQTFQANFHDIYSHKKNETTRSIKKGAGGSQDLFLPVLYSPLPRILVIQRPFVHESNWLPAAVQMWGHLPPPRNFAFAFHCCGATASPKHLPPSSSSSSSSMTSGAFVETLPWFAAALTQKVFASERVASQQTHFLVRLWGETFGGGGASGESQQTSSSSLVSECFRISLTSRSSLILHPASRRMEPDGITTIKFTAEVASTQQQRQQSRLMMFLLPFRRRWLTRPRDLQPPGNNQNRWKCIKTSFHSSFVPLTAAFFKKKRGSPPARLAQRQQKPAGNGRGRKKKKHA